MAKKTSAFDYREKAAELEKVVAELQNPDIQIDEATRLHAEGVRLIAELEAYLNQAEIEVKKRTAES